MSSTTSSDCQNSTEADFPRVMAYVTERAIAQGLEEEVMAALFDVLDTAAARAEGC